MNRKNNLPHKFEYLRQAVELCVDEDLQGFFGHEMPEFISKLTNGDLALLATAFNEIEKREDVAEISQWYGGCPIQELECGFEQPVFRLFLVFSALYEKGIAPFSTRRLPFLKEIVRFDWSKLPDDPGYLAEPAEHYGKYQFDSQVNDFLSRMTNKEEEAIRNVAEIIVSRDDYLRIDQWFNEHPITDHPEAANVYFLLGLIDSIIG